MITILLYVLIVLLALYFIFFTFIPIVWDYRKEKKSNWEINNIIDYYSNRSKVITSAGNGLTNIIGIIAIMIAVASYISSNQQSEISKETLITTKKGFDTSVIAYNKMVNGLESISVSSNNIKNNFDVLSTLLSNFPIKIDSITNRLNNLNASISEQIRLTEKEYSLKLNPLLTIIPVEKDLNNFSIIGYKFINDGEIDIEDLKIKQSFRTYNISKNTFGSNLQDINYRLKCKLLKVSDSIFIPFDFDDDRINTFRVIINEKGIFYDKDDINDKTIGVLIDRISYKKPNSKQIYYSKRILICYDTYLNSVLTFMVESGEGIFAKDEIKLLINKIDILDNTLN